MKLLTSVLVAIALLVGVMPAVAQNLAPDSTTGLTAAKYKSMIAEAKLLRAANKALTGSAISAALNGRAFVGRTADNTNFALVYATNGSYRLTVDGMKMGRYWAVKSNRYCAAPRADRVLNACTDLVFKVNGGFVFWQNNKVVNAIAPVR